MKQLSHFLVFVTDFRSVSKIAKGEYQLHYVRSLVCFVRLEQLSTHWAGIRQIFILIFLENYVKIVQHALKPDENNGQFT
jgi:hypothetical protein